MDWSSVTQAAVAVAVFGFTLAQAREASMLRRGRYAAMVRAVQFLAGSTASMAETTATSLQGRPDLATKIGTEIQEQGYFRFVESNAARINFGELPTSRSMRAAMTVTNALGKLQTAAARLAEGKDVRVVEFENLLIALEIAQGDLVRQIWRLDHPLQASIEDTINRIKRRPLWEHVVQTPAAPM